MIQYHLSLRLNIIVYFFPVLAHKDLSALQPSTMAQASRCTAYLNVEPRHDLDNLSSLVTAESFDDETTACASSAVLGIPLFTVKAVHTQSRQAGHISEIFWKPSKIRWHVVKGHSPVLSETCMRSK